MNPPRTELSSVFDAMLAQNKKRFDDLYLRGRRNPGEPAIAVNPPAGREPLLARIPADTASVQLDPDSLAVRRLKQRFGNDWRCEIAEQPRNGDEAIVLCKLIFGKDGAVRTQFGRAKISQGEVAGASGDVRFKFGAEQDPHAAWRRAAEAALMNCIDLI